MNFSIYQLKKVNNRIKFIIYLWCLKANIESCTDDKKPITREENEITNQLIIKVMNSQLFQQKLMSLQSNMFNFAMLLTSNRDDAQDLLQDTTLKALDNQEKFVDNVNFKGWVLTIMRHTFINNYHKVLRTQTVVDQEIDLYNLNLTIESGIDSPDGAYAMAEINKAIEALTDELKVPFSMFLTGFKYNEIADELHLPLGTIKSRIFFARKTLQEKLRDFR